MNIVDKILDFVFPKSCLVCGKSRSALCKECLNKIPQNLRTLNIENLKVNYLYNFKDPTIHQALWQAKYHANLEILETFGKVLGSEIMKNFSINNTFLIPIPLTNSDARLHNHAVILASSTGFQICDILEKNTIHKQARLTHKQERVENINGKICVSEKKLSKFLRDRNLEKIDLSKNIFLLIDDTVTTGSTLLEAKYALSTISINIETAYTLAH